MTTIDATIHRWTELETDQPMPLITRRRVIGEQAMLSHVTLEEGFNLDTHQHMNEQFAVVLEGRIRFGIGEPGSADYHEIEAVGGEVVELPANVPHSAHAVERTLIIDVFSPPSATTGIDKT